MAPKNDHANCNNPTPMGWLGAAYFIIFVIFAAQVLLTLFIGSKSTFLDRFNLSPAQPAHTLLHFLLSLSPSSLKRFIPMLTDDFHFPIVIATSMEIEKENGKNAEERDNRLLEYLDAFGLVSPNQTRQAHEASIKALGDARNKAGDKQTYKEMAKEDARRHEEMHVYTEKRLPVIELLDPKGTKKLSREDLKALVSVIPLVSKAKTTSMSDLDEHITRRHVVPFRRLDIEKLFTILATVNPKFSE